MKTMREKCEERRELKEAGLRQHVKIEVDEFMYYIPRSKFFDMVDNKSDHRNFMLYADMVFNTETDSFIKCRWSKKTIVESFMGNL